MTPSLADLWSTHFTIKGLKGQIKDDDYKRIVQEVLDNLPPAQISMQFRASVEVLTKLYQEELNGRPSSPKKTPKPASKGRPSSSSKTGTGAKKRPATTRSKKKEPSKEQAS